jgi:hypothetical protein
MSEHHSHDTHPVEALSRESHVEDAAEAKIEQPVFEYDADTLSTLTADQMDVLEHDAWTQIDAGQTPEQVQAELYQKLTDLGFDLSSAQHDQLVVRFTGVDGKEDVRAIKIDYQDFGTRVKAAELHAVTPRSEVVEDEQPTEKNEQDDAEQEAIVSSLREHLNQEVSRLDMNSEDDRRLREKLWSDVSDVAERVRRLTRQIYENGPIDRIALRQLEDRIMNDTVKPLVARGTKTEQDRVWVSRLEDSFAEVHHEVTRKLDSAHTEAFQVTMQRANAVRTELGANRTREDAATHRAGGICAAIGRVIGEMSTSRYGYESSGSQLRQLSAELEQEIARHSSSESQLRRLSTELQSALGES